MSNIMRVSDAASLAIHAVKALAESPETAVTVSSIAEKLNVSEAHLAKVLQRLTRAKMVSANRGPGGGFKLTRDPANLTLLDVYEAIEGPLEVNGCLLGEPACGSGLCMLATLMRSTQTDLRNYFKGITFAQIATDLNKNQGALKTSRERSA